MSEVSNHLSPAKGRYLLSVEEIPPTADDFPAYFVGSTAPNNVEDGIGEIANPQANIDRIAAFLCAQAEPEILIAIHGYNTSLGNFATPESLHRSGVKGWYQEIRDHITRHCDRRSPGLVLIGYRWPSEQIKGGGNDRLSAKFRYAQRSLPIFLRVILGLSFAVLGALVLAAFTANVSNSVGFSFLGVSILVVATIFVSLVLTLFLLRIVGYLRDAYRATYYGVPDLVELVRQIDKAVIEQTSIEDWAENQTENQAGNQTENKTVCRRIKLSFIAHSMGGFVATDTVRVLSDVFDQQSIGNLGAASKAKVPSSNIGHVFSLGRLVLVAPDIPAETIISGRANFLSSSLRRFEETYLFSNEGDMALKLASTAANYASFPTKTREGGYRLGNVVVRSLPENRAPKDRMTQYGIVNFDAAAADGGQLINVQTRSQGGIEPKQIPYVKSDGSEGFISSFLSYLYILPSKALTHRQQDILGSDQKPIAELFTVFDCTDYYELLPKERGQGLKKVGLLSYSIGQRSLNFWNYVRLALATFSGKIDSHGGYFYTPPLPSATGAQPQLSRPDAYLSKQLIYGLACLGFSALITSLSAERDLTAADMSKDTTVAKRALKNLSEVCADRHIQILLAAERYNRDILGIVSEGDRTGY